MITTNFITNYTTGLYSVKESARPTYDEFRDMFSSGQLKSKEWAVSSLSSHLTGNEKIVIAGSWFGTLGLLIHEKVPTCDIVLMDVDPRCKEFVDGIAKWNSHISSITADMYEYTYTEDVVINTSCEHIPDLKGWLGKIPKGTKVLLQSNNNDKIDGHVNCCHSTDEFLEKAGLSEVFYRGEYIMPMYTRYMILGKV